MVDKKVGYAGLGFVGDQNNLRHIDMPLLVSLLLLAP
jgi:hypothetical protein